jgi:hypothetical protein
MKFMIRKTTPCGIADIKVRAPFLFYTVKE